MSAQPEGCPMGKVQFAMRGQAITALLRMGRQREMTAYRCPHCGLWHVGHPPGFGRCQEWKRKRNAKRGLGPRRPGVAAWA